MYLLGYDIGSSSIKASLLDVETGQNIASAHSPDVELEIQAPHPGWAEQDPEIWWKHVGLATARLWQQAQIDQDAVQAIGISYQMHGLVMVDRDLKVIRPSIIWCDSRAVEIGNRAFAELGSDWCLGSCLNSPGNFTASKLRWVLENEPEHYQKCYKAMLPGDFIALRLTDEVNTTASGLSEGILWNMKEERPAARLMEYYEINDVILPTVVPTFSNQGELTRTAAEALGLRAGIPVAYRAGDQPNNAFSLGVMHPGQLAATAGTSGVVYGVGAEPDHDPLSRVNTFLHVNHRSDQPRYGVLLCVNGTGSLNRWIRQLTGPVEYDIMNTMASKIAVGSNGVSILPFGNGAERTLENVDIGASIHGVDFNRHNRAHLYRATQEGIVFALQYGIEVMREMGLTVNSVRAGRANMFLSPLFCEAFATVTGAVVTLFETDGAQGAARGAGLGAGIFESEEACFGGLTPVREILPMANQVEAYREAYGTWKSVLDRTLKAT